MIVFENIDLKFDKPVFTNLSLTISKGDKITILGKSGTGKSSLFNLLLGFISPCQGKVYFHDKIINEKSCWDIRKQISYVDQDVSLGDQLVNNWLDSVFHFKANALNQYKDEKLKELMKYFELETSILKKNIQSLSGGERQRIAIIVAVLLKRDTFLLDEVTSALDLNLKQKVVDFFISNETWTVISISHDPVWTGNKKIKLFNLEELRWIR